MTDYQNAIDRLDSIAPTLATTSLDQNPDEGARALALSRATGVPALTVYDDLPEFESDHRAKLTTSIVRGNDQLAAYLRGNPLADVVSNDDYGNTVYKTSVFNDKDGTITGVPNSYIVNVTGIDADKECQAKPTWNAVVCKGDIGRMNVGGGGGALGFGGFGGGGGPPGAGGPTGGGAARAATPGAGAAAGSCAGA